MPYSLGVLPTLRCFFAIYTDGARPLDTFSQPGGVTAFLGEMDEVIFPSANDELFGPSASAFARYKPKRGFLLGISKEVKGASGTFFNDARSVLLEAIEGIDGWGIDVLRLWPFALNATAEAVPDEFLAEDLFAVSFSEHGAHGYRAETFGLAKLGQRELTFELKGKELLEEAALFCGHVAEWILDHGLRVEPNQALAFGFDRVVFTAAEGSADEPFRGWHPEFVQRVLPRELFPGVGVLEVRGHDGASPALGDLTPALQHSQAQRQLLEDLDLTGDAPHHTHAAELRGEINGLKNLVLTREEPDTSKDSGWRLRGAGDDLTPRATTLGMLASQVPDLLRYFALPSGVRLEWDAVGRLSVDLSRVELTDVDEDDGE